MINSVKIEGITVALEAKEDGIYLVVNRPEGNSNKLDFGSIRNLLDDSGIQDWDFATVLDLIENTEPTVSVLASRNTEFKQVDEEATIIISPDKMLAEIVFTKPKNGGEMLTRKEIENILKENRVFMGVDENALMLLEQERVYDTPCIIARGKEPVNGENGYVEYLFNTGKASYKPKELEDGKIDYLNLDIFQVAQKNAVLARVSHPTQGIDGYKVGGEIIKAMQGKAVIVPAGKNVRYDEAKQEIISEIDGQIVLTNNKITVSPVLEIGRNVDNSTGNINFLGTVVVKGNVLTGFSISATGNVEVQGVVEGASISCDGDLCIRGGVQGMGKASLSSKKTITAKFIESANVWAEGDIIADSILRCNLKCNGALTLTGKRGQLIGGSAKVLHTISASVIGSPMEAQTEVQVGLDPDLFDEYMEKKAEIARLKKELAQVSQIIETLAKAREQGTLTEVKKAILVKSLQSKASIKAKTASLLADIEKIVPELTKGTGRVKVQTTVNPGVKITIGNAIIYIKEKIDNCTFTNVDGEINVGPY